MRVRKLGHQKDKPSAVLTTPLDLTKNLNDKLANQYNHSDKYYYLRELRDIANKPKVSLIKDYGILYENKEILQKYIDTKHHNESFNQAVSYYKYYEDIPRIYIQGFQTIIQKHVEAKRVKRYSDLKLVTDTLKSPLPTGSYSNFMSLFRKESKEQRNSAQSTLLCLKHQLSFVLKEKSWVERIQPLNPLSNNGFFHIDIDKWNNSIEFKKDAKDTEIRRYWGSMQLTNTKTQFTNTKIKQKLQKRTIIRMKTTNFMKKTITQNMSKKQVTQRSEKQNKYKHKSNKSQSKSPSSKTGIKPLHVRMHSQPFSKQKPLNHYLLAAMQMQRSIQVPKLKKRRKNSTTLKRL